MAPTLRALALLALLTLLATAAPAAAQASYPPELPPEVPNPIPGHWWPAIPRTLPSVPSQPPVWTPRPGDLPGAPTPPAAPPAPPVPGLPGAPLPPADAPTAPEVSPQALTTPAVEYAAGVATDPRGTIIAPERGLTRLAGAYLTLLGFVADPYLDRAERTANETFTLQDYLVLYLTRTAEHPERPPAQPKPPVPGGVGLPGSPVPWPGSYPPPPTLP